MTWQVETANACPTKLSLLTVGLLVSLVSGGFRYLVESPRVPGWLIVVGMSAVVILLVQVLAQRRRIRKLSPKTPQYKDEAYRFADLEWILTPQFFLSYAKVMPKDANPPNYLNGLIRGPICRNCKRDAAESVRHGNKCLVCKTEYRMWKPGVDPSQMGWVRMAVYLGPSPEGSPAKRRSKVSRP